MKAVRVIVYAATLVVATSGLALGGDASAVFKQAYDLYKSQNYAAAYKVFEDGLRIDPENVTALYYEGLTLEALQRADEATARFDHAYSLQPSSEFGAKALAEKEKLAVAAEDNASKQTQLDALRSQQAQAIKAKVGMCFQVHVTEAGNGNGSVCVCIRGYDQSTSLENDIIRYFVLHDGVESGTIRFGISVSSRGPAASATDSGNKISIPLSPPNGVVSSHSFVNNDAAFLAAPVHLSGDAAGSSEMVTGNFNIDVRSRSVSFDSISGGASNYPEYDGTQVKVGKQCS